MPDFPTGVGFQNYDNWSRLLDVYLEAGIITPDTTIFAHSIAPVFLCKYLISRQVRVKKLVFVCGFNNYLGIDAEYDSANRGMFLDDVARIREYCDEIVCLYSDNDPYVPYDVEKSFADSVATYQKMIPGGGHLNSESGYREFPELLQYI